MHSITQSNEHIFRETLERICSTLNTRVLVDIGSGNGDYSMQIAKLVQAKKIICVDHDQKALKHAKKLGCHTIISDLNQRISLSSNSADLIIINQVIEHVAKTDHLVKEVRRILKPGGTSIWCTPNLASWHNIFALSVGYQPFSSQISDECFLGNPWHPENNQKIKEAQAHLRLFTIRSLSNLLEYHSLSTKSTLGVGYYPLSNNSARFMSFIDPIHAAYVFVVAIK